MDIDLWMGKVYLFLYFKKVNIFSSSYGSHTFKMVNADNEPIYCKFHWKTDQGIKCFDRHQADEMAKQDPDFAIR